MENIAIAMIRRNLQEIPEHALPSGYALRAYRPGDKKTWLRIHEEAERLIDVTGETFDRNFGYDLEAMPRRCSFLVAPGGRDVGTITAWYIRGYHRRRWGRIHWVAISPSHQGKGLAKPMMTMAMHRLRKFGHRRAMLTTATPRLRAIKVYLDFGFRPDMARKQAQRAWRLVAMHLPHPGLAGMRADQPPNRCAHDQGGSGAGGIRPSPCSGCPS